MSGILEQMLSEELNTSIVLVNTGVAGWGPNHYLVKTRKELAREEYELILVFVYVGNDILRSRQTWIPPRQEMDKPIRMPRNLTYREMIAALVHPLYLKLRTRSHLVVLLKKSLLTFWMRFGFSKHDFNPILLRSEAQSPHWDITCNVLKDIASEAVTHNTPVLFILLPPDYQVDKELGNAYAQGAGIDLARVDLDQPTKILETKLVSKQLHVYNPTPHFKQLHASGVKLYGKLDRHLEPKGHEAMARLLKPVVLEYLLSPTP